MNGLNNSVDDVAECPLCMEPLEVDDLNFYPCTCGYQICRFCWHRIRTDENELCPACRKEYPENPADFTPLTQEEMIAFKSQKRQRDQQRKQKITENRKHLANVRVVQKNLVFVVGLPPRLADADILKKHEYFGKYGKIHKVVINPSTAYAGVQGPSASAYVTYVHNSDALRAIQSVNNINIDGRLIKTSLGTTKYCSHFMKNQPCPKNDCMYLHELGDPEASFTKEEMHQGKHQEYEKRLHDALIATAGTNTANGLGNLSSNQMAPGGLVNTITNSKNCENTKGPTSNSTSSSMSSSSSSGSSSSNSLGTTNAILSSVISSDTQKDAWPSLLGAAANNKDTTTPSTKSKKEKSKNERSKNDRKSKVKNNQNNNYKNSSSTRINNYNSNEIDETTNQKTMATETVVKVKAETTKEKTNEKNTSNLQQQSKEKAYKEKSSLNLDEEIKLISEVGNKSKYRSNKLDGNNKPRNSTELRSSNSYVIEREKMDENNKLNSKRCNSSSSNASICSNNSSSSTSSLSDSVSGKSSPETERFITEKPCEYSKSDEHAAINLDSSSNIYNIDTNIGEEINKKADADFSPESSTPDSGDDNLSCNIRSKNNSNMANLGEPGVQKTVSTCNSPNNNLLLETLDSSLKLNDFEDNSFFSSNTAASNYNQSLFLKNKPGLASDIRQNQLNSVISSHLPDLLSDWEEAFKNVILRSNKQMEEQLQKQHFQQQQQHIHFQQQEDYHRMQDLQKRSSLLNNMGMPQMNSTRNDFSNNYHSGGAADLNGIVPSNLLHHNPTQQQMLPHASQQTRLPNSAEHLLENSHFGHNMSKFFDFHKNQQQQQQLQQQFLINNNANGLNSVNEHLRMGSFLDNNHMNAQFLDQNIMPPQQQIAQKQRVLGKFDSLQGPVHTPPVLPQKTQQQQVAHQQIHPLAQFPQNISVEDDLGFDPFIETQKGLAELMENEVVQQQSSNNSNNCANATTTMASKFLQQQQQQQIFENMQRARMPPPGFNHMNSFNFASTSRVQNSSKILPLMNGPLGGMPNTNSQLASQQQQAQQQLQMPHAWNLQINAYQQQQQQQQLLNDSQLHQMQNHHQTTGNHKGYSSNDWTAMDPAILSLRQFSSFSQQPTLPQHHASPAQDLFMQHLPPHQQNNQGFISQQSLQSNSNLANGLLGVQQTTQPQATNRITSSEL